MSTGNPPPPHIGASLRPWRYLGSNLGSMPCTNGRITGHPGEAMVGKMRMPRPARHCLPQCWHLLKSTLWAQHYLQPVLLDLVSPLGLAEKAQRTIQSNFKPYGTKEVKEGRGRGPKAARCPRQAPVFRRRAWMGCRVRDEQTRPACLRL